MGVVLWGSLWEKTPLMMKVGEVGMEGGRLEEKT